MFCRSRPPARLSACQRCGFEHLRLKHRDLLLSRPEGKQGLSFRHKQKSVKSFCNKMLIKTVNFKAYNQHVILLCI